MSENLKTPKLSIGPDNVGKAWDMANAGNEDRTKAVEGRGMYQQHLDNTKKNDPDAQEFARSVANFTMLADRQADKKENKAAYDYEMKNAHETYSSYISALPEILDALDIDPKSTLWSQLFNEINQNIIEGKYNSQKVEDYKNERGRLPAHLQPGLRLDISKSKSE